MKIADWVEAEFKDIDFGDARLGKRLKVSLTAAANRGTSEPHRYQSDGALKGMYRFVNHDKVQPKTILQEHHAATVARCQAAPLVYLAQDTTEVNLTRPKVEVEGTGPLRNASHRGFFYHPSLALNQDGVPLGVVDEFIWTRDAKAPQATTQARQQARKQASLEEKESCRWLEIMQSNEQLARSMAGTQFVMLADSEADITRLFCESADHPDNFFMIIRGCHNHNLSSAHSTDGKPLKSVGNVEQALAQTGPWGERTIDVPSRPQPAIPTTRKRHQRRTPRQAVLEIRCLQVVVAGPPQRGGGALPDVAMNVVEVMERDPPAGETPIAWTLYTTLPTSTLEQAWAVADGYQMRWQVELFFKTLKSGLGIEKLKYQTLKRYLVAFSILTVVAWKVEHLKMAARADGDASCEKYVSPPQWQAVDGFHRKSNDFDGVPVPTMSQYVVSVAKLGGYINRKAQGPPGSMTLWKGVQTAETLVQAFLIYNP